MKKSFFILSFEISFYFRRKTKMKTIFSFIMTFKFFQVLLYTMVFLKTKLKVKNLLRKNKIMIIYEVIIKENTKIIYLGICSIIDLLKIINKYQERNLEIIIKTH